MLKQLESETTKINSSFLESEDFKRLEKEYGFLRRAKEQLRPDLNELERTPYIIVDIETTGLYPDQNEIIEIGAIKVEKKMLRIFLINLSNQNLLFPKKSRT